MGGAHVLTSDKCFYSYAAALFPIREINIFASVLRNFIFISQHQEVYKKVFQRYDLKDLHLILTISEVFSFAFDVNNYPIIHLICATIVICGHVFRGAWHV